MKKFFALLIALIFVSAAFFFIVGNNSFMMLVIFNKEDHQFEVILEEVTSYNNANHLNIDFVITQTDTAQETTLTNTINLQLVYNYKTNTQTFLATNKQKKKVSAVVTEVEKKMYYDGTELYTNIVGTSKTKEVTSFVNALISITNDNNVLTEDVLIPLYLDLNPITKQTSEDYTLNSQLYFSFNPLIAGQLMTYEVKDIKYSHTYLFDTFRNLRAFSETYLDSGITYNIAATINSMNKEFKLNAPSTNELATYL